MPRLTPHSLALLLTTLALGACGETTNPTPPAAGGESPAAPSFALAQNTWAMKAPRPSGADIGFSVARANNSAGQSVVYVIGGAAVSDVGLGEACIQAYNVATDTWTNKGACPGQFNMNGVGNLGGLLYFSGGYASTRGEELQMGVYAYDPVTDQVIRKADMPEHVATADGVTGVINGKLYVLVGTCNDDLPPFECSEIRRSRRLYRYEPAANTWAKRPWAPHSHAGGAGVVINGKLYVVGGAVASLDVYDPVTNRWTSLAPAPMAALATGASVHNKFLVLFQSFVGTTPTFHAYAYDPVTNSWKKRADPLAKAGPLVGVRLDGQGYGLSVGTSATQLYAP